MICVDASLVIKWLTPETDSAAAIQLFDRWRRQKEVLIGPLLLDYEVGSALCSKVKQGLLSAARLTPLLAFYRRLPIQLQHELHLLDQAIALALSFEGTSIYDCMYLALAQFQSVDYYTCDRKFFEKVKGPYPQVKYFEEA